MGNQVTQRLNLATQAADACKQFLDAYNQLVALAARRPFLGNFADADFTGTSLAYLDAGTIGVLFDAVVPNLTTASNDAGNGGQMKQILQQVAGTI